MHSVVKNVVLPSTLCTAAIATWTYFETFQFSDDPRLESIKAQGDLNGEAFMSAFRTVLLFGPFIFVFNFFVWSLWKTYRHPKSGP